MIVRDFQSVIGRETREQCLEQLGRLPDVVVACVGGGSNAAGMFYPFVDDADGRAGRRRGRRPRRRSRATTPPRSATASPACCTAASATCCRTTTARPCDVHSISAGLDYPGVGPEHSYWKDTGRVRYVSITDDEALDAFDTLRQQRRHPARPGSRHAVAQAMKEAARLGAEQGRRRLPLRPRRQGRLRGRPPPRRADLTVTGADGTSVRTRRRLASDAPGTPGDRHEPHRRPLLPPQAKAAGP